MKTPRNPEEIEQLRNGILEQALNIIISGGMDALTMRNLASRTGMTAPNLYNYFSGKDEIYISIVIRGFEMLHADLKAAYDGNDKPSTRARTMIDAYMRFGMTRPQYYDIMFTRPTPKYNDYVGTPFETLSRIELRISMEIAELALNTAAALTGAAAGGETIRRRVIEIWSLLHGMITLHNSRVVDYVVEQPERVYTEIIDRFLKNL